MSYCRCLVEQGIDLTLEDILFQIEGANHQSLNRKFAYFINYWMDRASDAVPYQIDIYSKEVDTRIFRAFLRRMSEIDPFFEQRYKYTGKLYRVIKPNFTYGENRSGMGLKLPNVIRHSFIDAWTDNQNFEVVRNLRNEWEYTFLLTEANEDSFAFDLSKYMKDNADCKYRKDGEVILGLKAEKVHQKTQLLSAYLEVD